MKRFASMLAASTALTLLAAAGEPIDLLASRDLNDWNHVLADKGFGKPDVWSFSETGHLLCAGQPRGFLATRQSYRNFILEVEWRWPAKPSNSGVLMRITGNDPIPACIEAQMAHGAAGRLMGLKGTRIAGETALPEPRSNVLRQKAGKEVPPGEWNHYRITAIDGVIVVELNGVEANRTTEADRSYGPIGFQSEGGPIEFRTIKLTPLDGDQGVDQDQG